MSRVEESDLILPRVKLSHSGGHSNSAMIDIGDTLFDRYDSMKTPVTFQQKLVTARSAFKSGKTKNVKYRVEQLKNLLRFLEECRGDIEVAVYSDLRKPSQEVNICEIELVANDLRYTIMEVKKWAKVEKPSKRLVNFMDGVEIHKEPYGVVLVIGSWNYPILLTLGPVVGAIAAGNCVILKPSEISTHTTGLLLEKLPLYLDRDTFHVVRANIEETTDILKEKFDYIFFTGSGSVGKIIHQAAAKHLTPTTLELGGKCPVYLDNTVDIHIATRRIIWGKCINSGQTCVGVDYLLCTKEVEEEFLKQAKGILSEFFGDYCSPSDVSRIMTDRHYQRLVKFISEGNVALGGICNENTKVIGPTILTNVKASDGVMQEEIFGPILPIVNVGSESEAIEFINGRDKPLALYVFTKKRSIQERFLVETSSGGVVINDTLMHLNTENLPFGGVGGSGMGRYHGKYGFDTFSHEKSVLRSGINRFSEFLMTPRYPPYSEFKTNFQKFVLKKRMGVPFGYFRVLFVFCCGIAFAYVIEYLRCSFNNCDKP